MRRLFPLCALLTGCFYGDLINQRPSLDIRQTSDDEVFRGSTVELEAVANDPEGDSVFYQWRVYACTDATPDETGSRSGCDYEPFYTEVLDTAGFVVPNQRVDQAAPVQAVFVILEAEDDYGAIARPRQELLIPISDRAPELEVTSRTRLGVAVVNQPVDIFAKVGDPDDGAAAVALEWNVFSPMTQPMFELVDLEVPDDEAPKYLQLGKRLTPQGIGRWEVQVIGRDPLGAMTTKSAIINVEADGAPCLLQWAPTVAPTGTRPLTEPTLFRINVVDDELDPYPTLSGEPFGPTRFAWTIKQPGASSRVSLGVTGNQVALDPGNYVPGDQIELRVEIQDRNLTPVNCSDAMGTCSVISDNACIQRLTWLLEVR